MQERSEKGNLNTEGVPRGGNIQSTPNTHRVDRKQSSISLPTGQADSAPAEGAGRESLVDGSSTDKQASNNMETHAHHLHNAPGKKFWHYLYEFLMLFLAIFCGFLAENFREHKVEEERGRQYIYSFRQDLIKDIFQCDASISELAEITAALDSLVPCFAIVDKDPTSTSCLKNIIIHSRGFKDFIYTDRTIQQLKNAGGLRLIEDKEIADSIIGYDATVREMQIHQGALENLQQLARNAHNNAIDFAHLAEISRNGGTGDLFLLSKDKSELNRYFNAIGDFKGGLTLQLRWMQIIKAKATDLFKILSKKGFE